MHLQDSIAYFYTIHSKFGRMKHLFMGIPYKICIFLGKKGKMKSPEWDFLLGFRSK